jgi:mannose-6-phosphate isomerase-like protein (cupin superfamily)
MEFLQADGESSHLNLRKQARQQAYMHYVSRIGEGSYQVPANYAEKSAGFRRAGYVDRVMGSVHMGVGICCLGANGSIQAHFHSFEESFYVLEGALDVQIGSETQSLRSGHFGLIPTGVPHSWRNPGDRPVRWLEMQAPQPRLAGYSQDTFFVGKGAHESATSDASAKLSASLIGHFDESKLPRPDGPSQMEGFNPTTGVAIKMFVDRSFGAIHQSLFLIQYSPGAKIDLHDHTFEESYLIVAGRVRATADGKTYDLGPGDVIWTGVGCIHSFENCGTEPVRWIETQAPLPPAKEVFRFERDWVHFAT